MKRTASCLLPLSALAILAFPGFSLAQQSSSTKPEVGILEHRSDVFSIINASVIPEPGKRLDKATIVIRDGKIVEIGTSVVPPSDSRTIDMSGKTIYAGFVDAGIELEVPPSDKLRGTPHWNSEITPERSMANAVANNDAIMAKLRKAGITTILVAPRDGIIKGTSAVMLTSNDSPADSILRSNQVMHVRLTVTRGRGRDSYPGSPMGAVALARQTFLDAQWYSQAWQTYHSQIGIEKPESNASLSAINEHVSAGKLVMFDALNEQYALRADAFGKEFGLNVILKGSGQEYQLLDPIAKLHRPILVPVNFPKPPNVASAEAALDVELEELTHWELAPENPSRLNKAGVKIALTTSGLSDPSEFLPQIRKAVMRGLDKTVAIEAITTVPANLLGIDSECGSIKPGSWANLVVTNGDLFEEKTRIEEVWVRGVRPATAYTNETSVDGQWLLSLSPAAGGPKSTSTQTRPHQLLLSIADSTKKFAGSIELVVEDGKQSEERSEDKKSDDPIPENKKTEGASDPKTDEDKSKLSLEKPGKNNKTEEKGKAKLKGPRWEDRTLTTAFPVDSLAEGQTGNGYLTLAMLPVSPQRSESILVGTLQWPDGQQAFVSASKKPAKPESSSSARSVAKDDSTSTSQKDSSKKATKESSEGAKPAKPILSDAWYPVGIQGRNGLPAQPEYVVFQNTTLWTCGPDGLLKDADLIIHRGLIHKIGIDLQVPEGAVVVDASKYQISPGLIDCHSHMATDSGINESTQAITAEVRIGDFIDASDITIYRQLAGGLTTANILHGSANPIGGQNQVIKLRWGGTYDDLKFADAPAGIKFALGENVKRSNSFETTSTRYPQSRMGVDQLIRDRFNSAKEYDAAWKRWSKERVGLPPRRDLELDAIVEILRGERWVHCHSYRQDEILGLLRVLEDFNIKIGSLQHILEGYKVAEALAKHGATASSFSDWWNYKFEVLDAIPYNGAILHDQGIVVSFNSDDAELGRHMNHEAAKAIKYGNVPAMEALKFVTLNPAKQLRIDSKVGSLEVGKEADISVWSGSPLSTLARCEQTWIDGRKYFDRGWDAEVRERDFKLHQALVQKILDSGESSGERSLLADDPSRLWPHHDEFCHHHHDESDDMHVHDADHEANEGNR
jgi:imidazolonepropionase-like amidohydrolase